MQNIRVTELTVLEDDKCLKIIGSVDGEENDEYGRSIANLSIAGRLKDGDLCVELSTPWDENLMFTVYPYTVEDYRALLVVLATLSEKPISSAAFRLEKHFKPPENYTNIVFSGHARNMGVCLTRRVVQLTTAPMYQAPKETSAVIRHFRIQDEQCVYLAAYNAQTPCALSLMFAEHEKVLTAFEALLEYGTGASPTISQECVDFDTLKATDYITTLNLN